MQLPQCVEIRPHDVDLGTAHLPLFELMLHDLVHFLQKVCRIILLLQLLLLKLGDVLGLLKNFDQLNFVLLRQLFLLLECD